MGRKSHTWAPLNSKTYLRPTGNIGESATGLEGGGGGGESSCQVGIQWKLLCKLTISDIEEEIGSGTFMIIYIAFTIFPLNQSKPFILTYASRIWGDPCLEVINDIYQDVVIVAWGGGGQGKVIFNPY
jgi:hypothetical protein